MSRIEACRICLITDVKLERIQGSLEKNIKNVFGCNIQFSSDLPDYACFECTALIAKYNKFKKKYFTAQSLLFNILQNHGMVTEKELKDLDRHASKLNSNLSAAHLGQIQLSDMKVECVPMEGIPEPTINANEEERHDSDSEDELPLKNFENVNGNNKNCDISPGKKKQSNIENNWGEPSNKIQKFMGSNSRMEDMLLLKEFEDSTLINDPDPNSIYLQEEESEIECNLFQLDDTIYGIADQSPAYNQVNQSPSGTISALSVQIIENQHVIISKLAGMSAQLDTMAKNYNVPDVPVCTSNNNINNNISSEVASIPAIENKKQLDDFENDLKDPEKKKLLHSQYSIYFKGRGQGLNCAYILIDALFSRKFLTTCSWAGGSRGEERKIALKSYKNTLIFLYELIQECDCNFSLLDCYSFIKAILRNSSKRVQSKGVRMSTSRSRRVSPVIEPFDTIDLENVLTNNPSGLAEET